MSEAHVLYRLQKYLAEYIEEYFTVVLNALRGVIVCKDLRMKAKTLRALNLPVTVKALFMDTLTMQVSWNSLGKGTFTVLIDHMFVLAEPTPNGHTPKDLASAFIEASPLLSRCIDTTYEAPSEWSWLDSLSAAMFGGFEFTINNLHIRYEDSISNPGHPFCSGVTLLKLAITNDVLDNGTFDVSGALDKLRESLQLLRLAVDRDSESAPWKFGKSWEDLNSVAWTKIFQHRFDELDDEGIASLWAKDLRYLVLPINCALKYNPLGNLDRRNPPNRLLKASLVLSDLYVTISETQYYWGIELLDALSTYKTHIEISHLRPDLLVLEDTRAWWRYAMLAGLQQKKLRCWFSWEKIKHLCQLRRLYVQMYSVFLQRSSDVNIYALRKIEKILDSEVILLWRWLAHAKLKSMGTMERICRHFGWHKSTNAEVAIGVGEAQSYSKKIN